MPHRNHLTCENTLDSTYLESTEAVAELNDVYETVEIVGSQDEAVALLDGAPSAEHEVPRQAVLQRASEVLVEDGVEIVVVSTQVSHLKHKEIIFYTLLLIQSL